MRLCEPLKGEEESCGRPHARTSLEVAINVLPMSGQDRAIAIPAAGGYLVALADGAGGTGNGAVAAECLIAFVTKQSKEAASVDWFAALCAFDDELSARPTGGQTTGVVAFIDSERVRGASVGDSSAWLIAPSGRMTDLTAAQRRRPLLGTGEALPVEFGVESSRKSRSPRERRSVQVCASGPNLHPRHAGDGRRSRQCSCELRANAVRCLS